MKAPLDLFSGVWLQTTCQSCGRSIERSAALYFFRRDSGSMELRTICRKCLGRSDSIKCETCSRGTRLKVFTENQLKRKGKE